MNALKEWLDRNTYAKTLREPERLQGYYDDLEVAAQMLRQIAEPDPALIEAVATNLFNNMTEDLWTEMPDSQKSYWRDIATAQLEALAAELAK